MQERQVRKLRKMQARLPDGRRRHGQFEKKNKRHGVHSLHGVRQKLPQRRSVTVQPDLFEKMVSNITEVKSRGGKVISLVTDNFNIQDHSDYKIIIPTINNLFTPSLSIIPLQLLAYYTSIGKGIDPDKPKNLAKSVTVE